MHRLQGEHLLLRHIWQPPILHMPKVHEMGCGKNKNTNKNGCTANISTMCFFFFLKVTKFIHAPTYTYNKVMRLLDLDGVVECM
jgi:hypothetical protein